jgi:hypothetical protein
MIKIARWIYEHLGDDYGGNPSPPGQGKGVDFGIIEHGDPQHIARIYNDGFELWLGTMRKWHVFYSAQDARRLAWFILWDWWAVSTWFGLKRKIWYWALHVIVTNRKAANTASTPTSGSAALTGLLSTLENIPSNQDEPNPPTCG